MFKFCHSLILSKIILNTCVVTPFESDFLRQAFEDVTPGWHMNKTHWNTVTLGGDVPEEELKRMVGQNYDLIKPRVRKQQDVSP